jgi:hypothetical protein
VAPGVLLDTFVGVDAEEGRFSPGGAGDHILEEFDVSRCVDDDVMTFIGFEKHPRGVNRDTLALLILEGVKEEGVFEGFGVPGAGGLHLFQLTVRQAAGVGHQTADHRTFPMIHVPCDHNIHVFKHFTYTLPGAGFPGRRRLPCPGPGRNVRRYWQTYRT